METFRGWCWPACSASRPDRGNRRPRPCRTLRTVARVTDTNHIDHHHSKASRPCACCGGSGMECPAGRIFFHCSEAPLPTFKKSPRRLHGLRGLSLCLHVIVGAYALSLSRSRATIEKPQTLVARRRAAPTPTRPMPTKARDNGSGTSLFEISLTNFLSIAAAKSVKLATSITKPPPPLTSLL